MLFRLSDVGIVSGARRWEREGVWCNLATGLCKPG
jgi:hypothetical protein